MSALLWPVLIAGGVNVLVQPLLWLHNRRRREAREAAASRRRVWAAVSSST